LFVFVAELRVCIWFNRHLVSVDVGRDDVRAAEVLLWADLVLHFNQRGGLTRTNVDCILATFFSAAITHHEIAISWAEVLFLINAGLLALSSTPYVFFDHDEVPSGGLLSS
jgi:hypothetical protein